MSRAINLKNLKNKNIHIVGIGGAEGSAVAEFLVAQGIKNITGHDFSEKKDFEKTFYNTHLSLKPKERKKALDKLLNSPIKINFKKNYLKDIEKAEVVFVSQVWFKYPQNLPILRNLKNKGVLFKTITNLYFELAPCPIIGITGTNGKTTTARLINNIFEIWAKTRWLHSPFRAVDPKCNPAKGLHRTIATMKPAIKDFSKIYFAGNDRQNVQVLDKLSEMRKNDVLILEISSTQLLNLKASPHIGVITNITPNHLDDHGSFENYIEAKKNLIRYQGTGDWAVLNWDDKETRKIIKESRIKNQESRNFLFSRKEELEEGCFVKDGKVIVKFNEEDFIICDVSDIKLIGAHNLGNVLSAVSAAFLYGVDLESIREGIVNYAGTKHRLKLLYNINGARCYDDTQATTPEATINGLNSFGGEIILLTGGDNKGMNYQKLAEKINSKVKLLILFPGGASDEIEKFIDKNKIDFMKVNNFSEAADFLKKYLGNKKTLSVQLDTKCLFVVLISPAAAHFYSKYVEGSGKSLKEWVKIASSS